MKIGVKALENVLTLIPVAARHPGVIVLTWRSKNIQ